MARNHCLTPMSGGRVSNSFCGATILIDEPEGPEIQERFPATDLQGKVEGDIPYEFNLTVFSLSSSPAKYREPHSQIQPN